MDDNNLPQQLIDTLENATYGRDYLTQLDADLMACVQPPKEDL